MSKIFLAAGVAALAIAAPISAKPGGGDGGGKGGQPKAQQGGGGKHGGGGQAKMQRGGGGGGQAKAHRGGGGGGQAKAHRGGGGDKRGGHAQMQRGGGGGHKFDGGKARERHLEAAKKNQERRFEHAKKAREQRFEFAKKNQERQFERGKKAQENRFEFAKKQREQRSEWAKKSHEQRFERAKKANELAFENRKRSFEQAREFDQRRFEDQRRYERLAEQNRSYDRVNWDYGDRWVNARGLMDACPPGLRAKNNRCLPPGHAKFVGQPINSLARYASFGAVPLSIQYLYPDNDDYYYRYGDGYVYRVDRQNDLVSSLIPLLAGGLLPGQMFPTNYSYANSYVPTYFDSFYPDTPYVDYRYAYGNAYAVDPYTGLIQDVVPTYGYGYGVGQALPAGYGYYNVPYEYRDLYPASVDTSYWYAPGAIYQVDPQTQLLTSVASLLAPGFTVGQQIPAGYNYYNVPMDYRQTYYDTPDAWYRYNNGNIYQVDPTTQLVTAIVASILT